MSDDIYISEELAKENAARRAAEAAKIAAGAGDVAVVDEALLEEAQQTPYHQSQPFQGKVAYQGQEYKPTSSEFESKVSWALVIGCLLFIMLATMMCVGIMTLAIW
ncbi:MAG: hypothetical protein FWF11_00090 [Coriobacteriia bacterium]|nr:hypothetical protein [Coriobacteriia bacterium]